MRNEKEYTGSKNKIMPDLPDVLIVCGYILLGVGTWLCSPAVSLICLGVIAIVGGVVLIRPSKHPRI